MAAAGSGIQLDTAEDFRGLTVACQMPETGQMVLKNYLIGEGLTIGGADEDADVHFVYVNDTNTAIAGCAKGEYDLCITNACMGYYAEQFGTELVGTVADFVETYPCCRQTCNQGTYESKWDALVRFETAVLRGYAFCWENRQETLDILEDYSGEERDFLEAQIYGTKTYTPAMRLSLDPDKDACIAFYEAMRNIGEIDASAEIWAELEAYFEEHDY